MKVKFLPQDIAFEIKPGESVLHVAQNNNIYIKSVCGGVPSCAECRVRITEGDYNVLPPSSAELSLIGTAHFVDRRRLSCQLKCFGDITIDLSEQITKEQTQKSGKTRMRTNNREESIESSAVRGSILAESALTRPAPAPGNENPEQLNDHQGTGQPSAQSTRGRVGSQVSGPSPIGGPSSKSDDAKTRGQNRSRRGGRGRRGGGGSQGGGPSRSGAPGGGGSPRGGGGTR